MRDGRDIFLVAEANGVGADELGDWVGERGVFDMLFEFSHTKAVSCEDEVWCRPIEWKLTDLKRVLAESQANTADNGWYPVFFENHDQPRSTVNFFRCEGSISDKAKALGTVLLTLRGTPFVMQGEELGYANRVWKSLDEFDDLQTRSQYEFALSEGRTEAEALAGCNRFSRDNARTPMQWDASADSPLSWYRKLAALRAERDELVAGSFEELMADDEQVYAYRRQGEGGAAVVLANLSGEEASYDAALVADMKLLAGTHGSTEPGTLRPLEAVVFGD